MNDLNMIKPKCVQNIINKFCYTIGMIPTSYKISLTYEEQILAIGRYLEEVVYPAINNNAEALTELQELFVDLKNYVENYFDNLDVQEEINNKLDEMAETGQLEQIIAQYLNTKAIFGFDNVNSLKTAENLVNGSIAETLGYYSKNDGGSALYKIRNITNDDIVDEKFIIALSDENLIAELIIKNNKLNIKQIGAKSLEIDEVKHDIKPYIESYLNKIKEFNYRFTLFIPTGVWYCSEILIENEFGFLIEGQKSWEGYACGGTTISSFNDNQDYIFEIGSVNQNVNNFLLKNITFSSGDYQYYQAENNFRIPDANTKRISSALKLHNCAFGIFENISFNHIIGECISFASTWELRFDKLNISFCSNITGSLLHFIPLENSLNPNANISNIEILELNVEAINGDILKTEVGCGLIDSVINNFHYEPNTCILQGCSIHELNDGEFDPTTVKHLALLNSNGESKLLINNIILNNISYKYIKYNNTQYIYDTINNISNTNNNASVSNIINNVVIQGMNRSLNIILQETASNVVKYDSTFYLGNILNTSAYNCIFNVKNFPTIINKALLKNTRNQPISNINNIFNAFCDYVRNADNSNRRYLNYDADTLNNNLLSVKPRITDTGIFANIALKGTKIFIRAKIQNGKTYKLTFNNTAYSHSYIADLVGTGNYKLYEIDLSTIANYYKDIPTMILYSSSQNTEDIDVSLDYFFFE